MSREVIHLRVVCLLRNGGKKIQKQFLQIVSKDWIREMSFNQFVDSIHEDIDDEYAIFGNPLGKKTTTQIVRIFMENESLEYIKDTYQQDDEVLVYSASRNINNYNKLKINRS